jgi:phosphate starvation-inducible PhoH-like protein
VPGNIFRSGVQVDAKSEGQMKYLQDIDQNDIVFAIGPAGTGKTFLAVMKAVEQLKAGRIRRIVLVRPAVEAGERLGFLPGDIQAKVNPYLRPIYDSLNTFLEFGQLQRLITSDVVEICPLAYMRGRTLDEAFIILDEAQNTTSEQMKMFLTRMGRSSKIVVTGDITQIDLTPGKPSGLVEVKELLKGVSGIAFAYLTKADIVRHPLVQKIVDAYEHHRRR